MVEKILKQLRLWQTEYLGKPPPETIDEEMIESLPFEHRWGDYEELSIPLN